MKLSPSTTVPVDVGVAGGTSVDAQVLNVMNGEAHTAATSKWLSVVTHDPLTCSFTVSAP